LDSPETNNKKQSKRLRVAFLRWVGRLGALVYPGRAVSGKIIAMCLAAFSATAFAGSIEDSGFMLMEVKEGSLHVLRLYKTTVDSKQTVSDQMPFPKEPWGFSLVHPDCEANGKPDDTVLAVVKKTEDEWFTTVHSAYRVNLATGRFVKIPAKGVRCHNPWWERL
jgi:hypothetical protein